MCKYRCHRDCEPQVPNSCNLPGDFVKRYVIRMQQGNVGISFRLPSIHGNWQRHRPEPNPSWRYLRLRGSQAKSSGIGFGIFFASGIIIGCTLWLRQKIKKNDFAVFSCSLWVVSSCGHLDAPRLLDKETNIALDFQDEIHLFNPFGS